MKARYGLDEEHFAVKKLIHTLREINFNHSWKNTMKVDFTPRQTTFTNTPPKRLMTETNIHELFSHCKETSRPKDRGQTTHFEWGRNLNQKNYHCIQFLKPFNYSDKMLTGLQTIQSKDVENIQPKTSKCNLTEKFKKDYIIGKIIGQGPYAEVRVALHRPSNKKMAIKIYEKEKLMHTARRKVVKRQIKILESISHPNIVKLVDVAETNHHLSLIMEYLPGVSLATALNQQSSHVFPQSQCRLIIRQIAKALTYLHTRMIAHKDIKLENIILNEFSQPKLIDFGFSTCIKEGTKTKLFCGTPTYMAPEIIQRREHRGQNADVWALGVIMFTMLVGYFPFQGRSDGELYSKIIKGQYPTQHIREMRAAHDLIAKLLTVNPDKRITASEILQHPWIKNQEKHNKHGLSWLTFTRAEGNIYEKSCPKMNYRQSHSQKKRSFELMRVKELSLTQRDMNRTSKKAKENIWRKQNQNSAKDNMESTRNMKVLNILKQQFQKTERQKTHTNCHRL